VRELPKKEKQKKKSWKEKQRERQRARKLLAGVCLVAVIFVAYGAWQYSMSGTTNNPQPAGSAPNFSLRDIDGTQFSLSQFRGKVIVVHFMAVSCHGQIYSIDDNQLRQLKLVCSNYCGKKQFAMVTVVASTCQTSDLSQIRAHYGITWRMGNDYDDGTMEIFNAYATYSIQDGAIVLIDKAFNVAHVFTESMTSDTLKSEVGQLL
jgi:peroxiredoxin